MTSEVSAHFLLPLPSVGWSFTVMSSKTSLCQAEACVLPSETCGGMVCPKSPDWDSDIGIWTEGEEISEDDTRSLQQVWPGPCWEGLRPCLDPRDVLRMRTTASRWNVPCTCG